MLKRKAEYDARQKGGTSTTSSPPVTHTTAKSSSSSKPSASSKSNKKPKLSAEDKSAHRDPSLYLNKQRTLVLSSRGISYRDRHLLSDLVDLLPHAKKDNKLDTKSNLDVLNELALLKNCNNILFFETRKHTDLYLWLSKASVGPSVKFLVQNVHTMAEVKMTGNCMKYSRPLLVFDAAFDSAPHLQLIKSLLHQCLASPKGHPKVKPFIDHVLSFYYLDNRIWIRHYQIVYNSEINSDPDVTSTASSSSCPPPPSNVQLVEIGPRLVLCPIRVFSGSFVGTTLWENEDYISPNALRAEMKARKGREYIDRQKETEKTREHKKGARMEENEIDAVFTEEVEEENEK